MILTNLKVVLKDLNDREIMRPNEEGIKEADGSPTMVPCDLGYVLTVSLIADNESNRGTATSRFDSYLLAKRIKTAMRADTKVEITAKELDHVKDCIGEAYRHNKAVQGPAWELLEAMVPVKLVEDKK